MQLEAGVLVAERYRLERLLGEGGMGVVWAAKHEVTRKPVALKLLKGEVDPERRSRFVREARAASAVRHPNVCEVHDVVELEDGAPVLVMELLAGESLDARIAREGKLPLAAFAAVFLPVLSAVGAAHALGIVHRDLKPENIFLTRAEGGRPASVKVLDFGIAKLTASEGDAAATGSLTATGSILGTPFYMSPEQAFGEKDIDPRADVWSLGLILYRCLSGVLPTQADNLGQVLKNILARPIRPLAELEPGLPPEITALSARMLCRARKDRPADLHEIVDALAPHTDVRAPEFGVVPASPDPASGPSSGGGASGTDLAVDPLAPTASAPSGDQPPLLGGTLDGATTGTAALLRPRYAFFVVAALFAAGGAYLALRDPAPVPAPVPVAAAPSAPPLPTATSPIPTVVPQESAAPPEAQPLPTASASHSAAPSASAPPRGSPRVAPTTKAKAAPTSNPLDRAD